MMQLLLRIRIFWNVIKKPSHFFAVWRDFRGVSTENLDSDHEHLKEAMEWLCRAQDVTRCGGVSRAYSFEKGWEAPYPETTGYIIPTFIHFSELISDDKFLDRALKMGDWEIEIQLPEGGVRGGSGLNDYPDVFNTGQVILGFVALYRKTKKEKYLKAAKMAADWLVSIQDEDGKWSKYSYKNKAHTYHSRVAWPLLEVFKLTNDDKYKDSAEKQLKWVLSNKKENGWIKEMSFLQEEPLTHTIAYTIRGLLESSFLLSGDLKEKCYGAAKEVAEKIMIYYDFGKNSSPYVVPKFLPATFDKEWKTSSSYSCLTGDAQMAIVWLKLYKSTGNPRFLSSALKITDQLKSTQLINSSNPGIRGAIAGSYPIWREYKCFSYINWAAKFFADALMLKKELMKRPETK